MKKRVKLREALLGFDARIAWDTVPYSSDARASEFDARLITGLPSPVSVDYHVWPSVFLYPEGQMPGRAWLPDDVMHLIGMHGSGYPKWIGANYPFWEDLDNLREFIKGNVSRLPAQYDIIACAWLDPAPDTVASYSETGPHIGPDHEVSPAQRDAAWEFLGFDVAEASRDNTYLCYVGPGGLVRGQRTWWSSLLNDHGLFDDIETAWKLVEERRNEYPDDVPFCLFGLWLVSAVR